MRRLTKCVLSLMCSFAMLVGLIVYIPITASAAQYTGPVSYYGQLQARGSRIIGSKTGTTAQVKGMSFFWSNWSSGYWNASVVDRMVDEFDCEILRCAYGVNDSGTPYDAGTLRNLRAVVERCIERDVYVIIDWHSHGAYLNTSAAVSFFNEMARDYGGYDNVIFEIYNEPTTVSWSTVKSYAQTVIPVIRQYSDNLVVVGCPTWLQDVDLCANDPVSDSNIAYTLHFYAGSHGSYLRQKAEYALNKGCALFVTEWGSVNADGNGAIDYASTSEWLSWMDSKGLSWCNWAINDKDETSSIFYSNGAYREAGSYLNSILTGWASSAPWRNASSSGSAPASGIVVQAEDYAYMSGVQTESCGEGGLDVGYIDTGDWMSYGDVSIPSSGWYTVSFRVASQDGGGTLRLEQNSGTDELAVVSIPSTGGWQNWTTVTADVYLNAGTQWFGIGIPSGGFNLNWFAFEPKTAGGAGTTSVCVMVEAEDYDYMSGIQTENCDEGSLDVGYIDTGDWMSYEEVSIPQSGWYTVSFRVASLNGGGVISLEQNAGANVLAVVNIPSTGSWQNWTTVTTDIYLNAGTQGFGIGIPSGGFNLNWFSFTLKK